MEYPGELGYTPYCNAFLFLCNAAIDKMISCLILFGVVLRGLYLKSEELNAEFLIMISQDLVLSKNFCVFFQCKLKSENI